MPVYQITYNTRNEYSAPVRDVVLEFLVVPADLPYQKTGGVRYLFEPDSQYYTGTNFFGFEVIRFRLNRIMESFSFTFTAQVNREETNPYDFQKLPLDEELKILLSDDFRIDNYLFLSEGEPTMLPPDYRFPVRGANESTFEFALNVNRFVHDTINYDSTITDPHRLIVETIAEKRGVCQDLSHLMIAILRKNGIPARYVSGYLNPGENAVGAAAVHAWLEVLIPGAGWIGFDPTNNLLEDYHYIKIAHGQDFRDCSTLKGIMNGTGTNQTTYEVSVQEQNLACNQ